MADLKALGPDGHNLLTASEASRLLADGTLTSVALVEACLARIAAREGEVRAWAHIDAAAALAQAKARDAEPRRSPLHGIPVGIKDIFDTFDMPTSYGSAIYRDHRPATDTAVVGLLRLAGAVILGKCVTTEFASPVPAGTRNPHDPARSPGVSSSGSAAAVADFMVPLSVGSQTGGSTILPAAFCGTYGYKASLTGLDRGGIRHLRPTLDTLGLFARSLADMRLMRSAILGMATGHAESPSESLSQSPSRVEASPTVGLCRTFNWHQAQPESREALDTAARLLAKAGAKIVDAELPGVFDGIEDSFRVISSIEGARALAEEGREHTEALNHYIRQAQQTAARLGQADYDKAQLHAIACRRELARIFGRCDVLLTPSACGEAVADLVSVSNSAFNRTWTLMHGPAVNIPAFKGSNGMPVGVQVVGPVGEDDRTLALANWIDSRLH